MDHPLGVSSSVIGLGIFPATYAEASRDLTVAIDKDVAEVKVAMGKYFVVFVQIRDSSHDVDIWFSNLTLRTRIDDSFDEPWIVFGS